MRHATSILAASAATLLGASGALAAPLRDGEQIALSGVTLAQEPWLDAQGVVSAFQWNFAVRDASNAVVLTGRLEQRVYMSATFRMLVMDYRIRDIVSSSAKVTRLDVSGYSQFVTNVDFRTDLLGVTGPEAAIRSGNGDSVTFTFFDNSLPQGVDHFPLYLLTNAKQTLIEGTATIHVSTGESVTISGLRSPQYLPHCARDLNRDGIINFADLNAALSSFGQACN